ncbi:hypothetical protein [Desulforamulus hydrothermalis]|uniref:Uncharacterized protein n=1 Tax=Desulforamulus hydrothermalis Lam5 = DSM 18033 TaxID=1121428 RepID=K8E022_9FIRM|nr:hypothetical protein [Desulforamulus hydrothermalis]CCO08809.1 conserved hypothetical protein [Desulforamulus hydrothermalis Lam5 = DSM 18033]SHG72129.1 hypothetical protein SAMN02745177_00124 [Desulforamulus hydrothermalis Lam5 = DSM 18033]
MLFPFGRPGPPPKGMPVIPGLPGLRLNLTIDHFQLLGTLLMMGLSQRPGFKNQLEELVVFIQKMQEAAEAISVQMEAVHKEFSRVKARMAEYQNIQPDEQAAAKPPRSYYANPLLHHLLRMLS